MQSQPTFVLDSSTLATIGALIGALAGAIMLLFRLLVAAKDAHIASLLKELEDQRREMIGQIEQLKSDRNYFRDVALRERGRVPPPRS